MTFTEELWDKILQKGKHMSLFVYHFTDKYYILFSGNKCIVNNFYDYRLHKFILENWKQKDYRKINDEINAIDWDKYVAEE